MCAKKYFYKYTDAKGAKKILEDLKILYSSPEKFNDPFDCKIGLRCDYEHEKFGPLSIGKLYLLLFSSTRPELQYGVKKDKLLELWESHDNEKKMRFIEDIRIDRKLSSQMRQFLL